MATYTWGAGYYYATTLTTSNPNNVTASGSTFTVTKPAWSVKGGNTEAGDKSSRYFYFGTARSNPFELWSTNRYTVIGSFPNQQTSSVSNGTTAVTIASSTSSAISTANVFTSSNKSSRTATIKIMLTAPEVYTSGYGWTTIGDDPSGWDNIASCTVTLNAPPIFNESNIYFTNDFDGVPYAGLTTANVKLSSLTAYYGGDFTGVGKAEFTIGSQTVSKANPVNNDVLSIPLNATGTFTPTVKVTDSRGQVTTHTLNAITVQGYVAPSVNFNVGRTSATGVPEDEGVYAVINPTFNFTDAIATLSAPTVAVTDDSGVTQTVSTTWYSSRASDGTLSGSVTWANLSSGDTVYGLVSITGDFNTQKSYQIAVTPEDSQGTGTTITQTLGGAYYTVDFYAGGHGIAFGQPATQDGFFCNMDAHFVDKNSVMRALFDFVYPVGSYYETSKSQAEFDPNVTWGGTWVLENAGFVHVSSGTGYTVSGATSDSGKGTKDGGEATHALTPSETAMKNHSHTINHNHGFTQPTITSYYRSTVSYSSGSAARAYTSSGSSSTTDWAKASGGAVQQYNGSSGGQTEANGSAHNNMQPYIVVNRWHRTA